MRKCDDSFADFVSDLTEREQPTCGIGNQDECEACGS